MSISLLGEALRFRLTSLRLRLMSLVAWLICRRTDHWWGDRDGVKVCRFCQSVGVTPPRYVRCGTCGLFTCRHQPELRVA